MYAIFRVLIGVCCGKVEWPLGFANSAQDATNGKEDFARENKKGADWLFFSNRDFHESTDMPQKPLEQSVREPLTRKELQDLVGISEVNVKENPRLNLNLPVSTIANHGFELQYGPVYDEIILLDQNYIQE